MKDKHLVKQGECLLTIAEKYYYYSWKNIYYHPSNSGLREKRQDPMCLMPGDVVYLPEKKTKKVPITMDKSHKFVIKRQKKYFTMLMVDGKNQALADAEYKMEFVGVLADIVEGITGPDGVIKVEIPSGCKEGKLTIIPYKDDPSSEVVRNVLFGHKDPVEETTGKQSRLNDLGYNCGKIDNVQGDLTQNALERLLDDPSSDELNEDEIHKKLKRYHPSLYSHE